MTTASLGGRVAIVTGAGRGIGDATARLFAERGASVMVADLDGPAAAATASAIRDAGGTADYCLVDVSDEAAVAALVARTVERFGRLDCAVNNAGATPDVEAIADTDLAVFDRIIAVNLRSVIACMKHEIRQLLAQGTCGAIVNISSINGLRPQPGCPAYTASKHGVIGLTKCGSLEYAPKGIRVNCVLPGAIETQMLVSAAAERRAPLDAYADTVSVFGRLGQPREIAEACLWLCSDASSYVTGHSLAVDAGYTAR